MANTEDNAYSGRKETKRGAEDRKRWKRQARKVVKAHYVLFMMLCLTAVFFGTEFGYVKWHAVNLYKVIIGQPIELGGDVLKLNAGNAREKVLNDLIQDNIEAGRKEAAQQLEAYENEKLTGTVVGRKSGVFAAFANSGRTFFA